MGNTTLRHFTSGWFKTSRGSEQAGRTRDRSAALDHLRSFPPTLAPWYNPHLSRACEGSSFVRSPDSCSRSLPPMRLVQGWHCVAAAWGARSASGVALSTDSCIATLYAETRHWPATSSWRRVCEKTYQQTLPQLPFLASHDAITSSDWLKVSLLLWVRL